MLYETRKGAKCVTMPGPQKRSGSGSNARLTYIYMQMLPVNPQRFEWVREDNLRRLDDEAVRG